MLGRSRIGAFGLQTVFVVAGDALVGSHCELFNLRLTALRFTIQKSQESPASVANSETIARIRSRFNRSHAVDMFA